jgi:hypothetical protein
LAIIVFERPCETQALRAALLVASLLYPYEINKLVYDGLLSISVGLLKNGRRYYGVMKHASMEIAIQRPTSPVELAKNGIPLVSLNAFNDAKGGYFGAVFMAIRRDLASFGRKIGVLLRRRVIERRLYLLLRARFDSMLIEASNWSLCKILHLLMLQRALLKICKRGKSRVSNGLRIRPI